MSMFRVAVTLMLFTIVLNSVANIVAGALPGFIGYGGVSPSQYVEVSTSAQDLNFQQVSTQSSGGYIIDASKGLSLLASMRNYVLGGGVLAQLFGMSPDSPVATLINAVEGIVYLLALIMFFTGRGD